MIVLDTHTLVWWVSSPDKLSDKAKRAIKRSIKEGQIFVSSISVWEIALLTKKGRLKLTMDLESWISKVSQLAFLKFVPVDNSIALYSVNLPGTIHSDPADRMIIATARHLGAKLVTSDKRILKYKHVRAIW